MGLFNIFKKQKSESKKPTVSVSFTTITPENNTYNPCGQNGMAVNDDYAIAAFVRISQSGAKVGRTSDDYARYFNYRFGVCDPISYHKKVISEGYLVEAPIDTALNKLKVDQLKSILDNAGFPNKGKKGELISRIMENIDVDSLDLEKYYVPSEKGMAHLKRYEYIFAVDNYGVSCKEYETQKEKYPASFNQNDIIWQTLNQKFNEHTIAGDYGLARNDQFSMAQLLEREGRNIDALCHYCLALYYDTSGCSNGNRIDDLVDISIAPGLADAIRNLKDYYDPQIVSRCYDRYKLPHHYISRQNFEKLIYAIFGEKAIDINDFIE